MATSMKLKFNKYKEQCSLILAVAIIFYLRFKMNLVHFYYTNVHASDACNYVEKLVILYLIFTISMLRIHLKWTQVKKLVILIMSKVWLSKMMT